MVLEIATKEDLTQLKNEVVTAINELKQIAPVRKEWLRSAEVMELLDCSVGTLQNLRITGQLPFSKVNGTIYYRYSDIMQLLENNLNRRA